MTWIASPARTRRRPPARNARAVGRRVVALATLWLAPFAGAAAQQQASRTDLNPHGKLETPCATCHTADGWRPVHIDRRFDHGRFAFPLVAAHAAVPCSACHASLDFSRAPSACVSCHQDVHRGELGTSCEQCHDVRTFNDRVAMAQTHTLTRFPLDGAHRDVDCRTCHAAPGGGILSFKTAPTECVTCHQAELAATTAPPHREAGFPLDCGSCHGSVSWHGTRFDHRGTRFPLTGAHLAAPCQACHADGVYAGKATTCVSCHQTDYAATTNPNHQTIGFSTDCASCHTTTTWTGAQFDHDAPYFPIYSGKHAHRWSACSDCHTSSTSYASFSCLTCHEHSQTETDGRHQGVAGYQYNSQACYSCHPRGSTN